MPFYGFGDIDTLDDLGPEVGIVGFVGDVWTALKKLNIPRPEPVDYPEELQEFFGRKIWQSTLGEARKSVEPIFIKPVEEKLFTGFVIREYKTDQLRVAVLDDDVPIWVSEKTIFESEYRCFVRDDEIIGVRLYKGDWSKAPDETVVKAAVSKFKTAPRAYSIDFGITQDGRTVIVECNDGYALGSYGLFSILYANFIEARWEELTRALDTKEGSSNESR